MTGRAVQRWGPRPVLCGARRRPWARPPGVDRAAWAERELTAGEVNDPPTYQSAGVSFQIESAVQNLGSGSPVQLRIASRSARTARAVACRTRSA
jgi:hypothetical protein